MKNLTIFSLLALVTSFAMIVGCKKGDTGPVGPAGPDSVQYSKWTVLNMSPMDAGDTSFFEDFTVPALTQKILSKGAVLGYIGYVSQSQDTVVENVSEAMAQLLAVGTIELQSYYVDFSQYFFYRYVIIPGSVSISSLPGSGSGQTYTVDELRKMSYLQVSQLLGMPTKNITLKKQTN